MIIDEINIVHVAIFKPKRDSPVAQSRTASQPLSERMAQAGPAEKRTLDLMTNHPIIPREPLTAWATSAEPPTRQI